MARGDVGLICFYDINCHNSQVFLDCSFWALLIPEASTGSSLCSVSPSPVLSGARVGVEYAASCGVEATTAGEPWWKWMARENCLI